MAPKWMLFAFYANSEYSNNAVYLFLFCFFTRQIWIVTCPIILKGAANNGCSLKTCIWVRPVREWNSPHCKTPLELWQCFTILPGKPTANELPWVKYPSESTHSDKLCSDVMLLNDSTYCTSHKHLIWWQLGCLIATKTTQTIIFKRLLIPMDLEIALVYNLKATLVF